MVRAPSGWTDVNVGDPGVTLVALFTWLALGLLLLRHVRTRRRRRLRLG